MISFSTCIVVISGIFLDGHITDTMISTHGFRIWYLELPCGENTFIGIKTTNHLKTGVELTPSTGQNPKEQDDATKEIKDVRWLYSQTI
jgi:hypothetical protein